MRIAIFNWRCFRHPQAGGSELYLYEQSVIWASKGHEILWFTSRPKGTKREEFHDGIRFVRAGGTFSVYILSALNYLRLGRADVVIDVENGIPFFTPFYVGVPSVLLIHHIHTDVWNREASWLVAKIGTWLESKAMPFVYRHMPIVTVSPSSSTMIEDLFGKHHSIEIVYNAISPDLKPGKKSVRPELIYLGRLRRYKSIDVLLHAVSQLSDLDPVLHLVGQGEDEVRLRELAQSLSLSSVVFHGFVGDLEKKQLLQQSWLSVNPSSMEGWGITNIEANACGVPVIGANVPGIRDSILEGKSGVLVPHGDADILAEKVRKLIVDDEYRERMSHTALEWAGKFSWSASADAFLTILIRILKKKSGDEKGSLPE